MGKKLEKRSIPANILIYLILILLAVSYLYPLYFMGVNSLKSQAEYMKDMFSVDLLKGHFENYLIIFKNFKIGQYLFNTLLVTVLKLVFTMPLAIFASYAFAKLRFRGKNAMYPLIISAMFIPFQVIMIPVYTMLTKLHMIDTYRGLILVTGTIGIPSSIMLLSSSFRSIPNELLEAAAIDGCGYFRKIFHIMIPMGKPAIAICTIMGFISSWNDLLPPMVIIKSVNKRLVMPALDGLVQCGHAVPAHRYPDRSGSGNCNLPDPLQADHHGYFRRLHKVNHLHVYQRGNCYEKETQNWCHFLQHHGAGPYAGCYGQSEHRACHALRSQRNASA